MIFVWQVSNSLNENSSVIWQDRVLSKDLPIKPKVRKTRFSSKSLALAKFSLNFRYKFKISFHKPFDVEKQIKSVMSKSLKGLKVWNATKLCPIALVKRQLSSLWPMRSNSCWQIPGQSVASNCAGRHSRMSHVCSKILRREEGSGEAYFYLVSAKSQIFFYYWALPMKTVFTLRIKIYHDDMMAYLHAALLCTCVTSCSRCVLHP